MAFDISTTCAKCGRKPPEVTTFTIISMDTVICSICNPPMLMGTCPTCGGHGDVCLFDAWAALNHMTPASAKRTKTLRMKFAKCRTKAEVRKLLEEEKISKGGLFLPDLLPDWLPE